LTEVVKQTLCEEYLCAYGDGESSFRQCKQATPIALISNLLNLLVNRTSRLVILYVVLCLIGRYIKCYFLRLWFWMICDY
jgi:hypothetical protein